MGTVRRAAGNFLSLSAAQIMSQAILFLIIIYLARILGAAGFGKIAFAQAVVLYFSLLANLGLSTLGTREVARNRGEMDSYVGNILSLRLVLALLSFFLLFIFVGLIKKPTEVKYLIILFGLSLFPSASLLDWLFRGIEKMGSIGISRILDKLFYAGLIFFLVKDAKHIWVVPCLWLGGSLLASGFLVYVFTRQFGRPRLRFNLPFWKELARRALPMGAAFIMIQIYYNLDTVMLGFMRNDEVVGWYTAAYTVVLFVWAFIPIFINVIFPLMSKYHQQSKEKLRLVISSATKLMSTIALPLGMGGTILAKPIMSFLYGEKYINGVIAFQILIWAVVIISIRCTYEQSFLACNREKRYLLGVIVGASVNIVLNLILIPYFGLKGAAIATVISEFIFSLYMLAYFQILRRVRILKYLLKPFLAASLMGFLLYYLRNLNLFLSILVGITAYLVAILLLKGVTWKEVTQLKTQVMGRTKL